MDNTIKLIFLGAVVLFGAVYVTLRHHEAAEPAPKLVIRWLRTNQRHMITALIVFIIAAVTLYALEAFLIWNVIAVNGVLDALIRVLLGFIFAVLAVETVYALNAGKDGLKSITLTVSSAFFFAIGFFSTELEIAFSRLASLETGFFSISVASVGSTARPAEARLMTSTGAVSGSALGEEAATPFRLGTQMLAEVRFINEDYERLTNACVGAHPAIRCDDWERYRTPLRNYRKVINALEPLFLCLDGPYKQRYPNGLPLQKDLSDMALRYLSHLPADPALPRERRAGTVPAGAGGDAAPDFVASLKAIVRNIALFNTYQERVAGITGIPLVTEGDGRDPCITAGDMLRDGRLKAVVDAENAFRRGLQAAAPAPAGTGTAAPPILVPHKVLLEAAIIAAAGFPQEAAAHIRTFADYASYNGRQDYLSIYLTNRLLSPLEYINQVIEDRHTQMEVIHENMDRLNGYFAANLPDFSAADPSPLLTSCSDGSFVAGATPGAPLRRAAGESGSEPRQGLVEASVGTADASDAEAHRRNGQMIAAERVGKLILYYVILNTRLFDAAANTTGSIDVDIIRPILKKAERFAAFITEEPAAFDDCIASAYRTWEWVEAPQKGDSQRAILRQRERQQPAHVVERYIKRIKFDILSGHALLLARQLDEYQTQSLLPDRMALSETENQRFLCQVLKATLRAWHAGTERTMIPPGSRGTPARARGSFQTVPVAEDSEAVIRQIKGILKRGASTLSRCEG